MCDSEPQDIEVDPFTSHTHSYTPYTGHPLPPSDTPSSPPRGLLQHSQLGLVGMELEDLGSLALPVHKHLLPKLSPLHLVPKFPSLLSHCVVTQEPVLTLEIALTGRITVLRLLWQQNGKYLLNKSLSFQATDHRSFLMVHRHTRTPHTQTFSRGGCVQRHACLS